MFIKHAGDNSFEMHVRTTVAGPEGHPTGGVTLPTQWMGWGCREIILNVNDWSISFLKLFWALVFAISHFFIRERNLAFEHTTTISPRPLGGRGLLGNGIYVGMTEWVYTCYGAATLQTSTVLQFVVLYLLLCFNF